MKRTKRPAPTVTGGDIVGNSDYVFIPQPAPHRCPNCGACPLCGHPLPAIAQPWVNPWPGYPQPYAGDNPWGGIGTTGNMTTNTQVQN